MHIHVYTHVRVCMRAGFAVGPASRGNNCNSQNVEGIFAAGVQLGKCLHDDENRLRSRNVTSR